MNVHIYGCMWLYATVAVPAGRQGKRLGLVGNVRRLSEFKLPGRGRDHDSRPQAGKLMLMGRNSGSVIRSINRALKRK